MHKLYVKDAQFYKKVAGISIPIALQGLITSGVNMMDTIMIGKVGETELSAVSLMGDVVVDPSEVASDECEPVVIRLVRDGVAVSVERDETTFGGQPSENLRTVSSSAECGVCVYS